MIVTQTNTLSIDNGQQFDVKTSSAGDKAGLLIDGLAHCYPEESFYYKSELEDYPTIEIDLKETRVIKGVMFYTRSDSLAPKLSGN